MKQISRLLALPFFLSAAFTAPAFASEMLLVVPVEVSKLPPDVHTARLDCRLFNEGGSEMDHVTTDIPLFNGGHSGQVRLQFRPSGYPLSANPIPDMASYSCKMSFLWTCSSGTSADGLCEWRPWFDPLHGSPGDVLFESPSSVVNVWEIEGEFEPDDAVELPRRFR